jgi:hypothetical protein
VDQSRPIQTNHARAPLLLAMNAFGHVHTTAGVTYSRSEYRFRAKFCRWNDMM